MFNLNLTDKEDNAVYVINLEGYSHAVGSTAVSFTHTPRTTGMLHTNVLLPTAQTIDLAIAEQEDMASQLASAIQQAYGSGIWPKELDADRIEAIQLTGLHKLQYGPEKRFFENDASFAMLLDMHARFIASAVEMMQLARSDQVEKAFATMTGQYARANRQVLWLLKNLKRRMRYARIEDDYSSTVVMPH